MSFVPKLKRIIVPPSIQPSSILVGTGKAPSTIVDTAATLLSVQIDHNTAISKNGMTTAATAGDRNNTTSSSQQQPPPLQRFLTIHPCKRLVAYVLNSVDVAINTNIHKSIIVQDYSTKEIHLSISWIDLASIVYGETDTKKFIAAAKSLGTIQSIQFYDPSILYWTRTMTSCNPQSTTDRFQALAIQTDKRVIILNLRRGPSTALVIHTAPAVSQQQQQPIAGTGKSSRKTLSPYRTVLAHLHEKTIGSIPSSNVLPLTDRWVLIGCIDGSLKCYDWISGTTVKKIKGLGKGDWIVQLLAANRYNSDPDTSPGSIVPSAGGTGGVGTLSSGLRRILTVTKKGIVYLIEIEIDFEKHTMDIQPPLGRFYIGSPVEVPAADAIVPGGSTALAGNPFDSNSTNNTVTDNLPDPTTATTIMGSAIIEHCIISYDAHMDRILWLTVPSKNKQQQQSTANNLTNSNQLTLSVWNLRSLQHDFLQQASLATSSGSSSKNLFKPDPTLVIQFPTTGTGNTTVASTVTVLPAHPAFSADTVVCATVNSVGDLYFYGAIALAANTTQTVIATPILGISVTNLLCTAIPGIEEQYDIQQQFLGVTESSTGTSLVRAHAMASQALPSTGQSDMMIATNLGLFIVDLPALVMSQGTHHCHFGAGLGSLGKSILMVRQSTVEYAMVDALTANPIGWLEPKNPTPVYDSPVPLHLPVEFQRRPFRSPPSFISSPSGTYVCLLWSAEFRYEILHIPTILQRVSHKLGVTGLDTAASATRNPAVAAGTSVIDFAWVGDDDTFSVLYADDALEQATMLLSKLDIESDSSYAAANLKQIVNVANLTIQATTKMATTTVTKGASTAASKVGAATQGVRVGAKNVTKEVFKKSFKMFTVGGKKRRGTGGGNDSEAGSAITADDDEDESEVGHPNIPSAAEMAALELNMKNNINTNQSQRTETKRRYVELKRLEAIATTASAPELGSSSIPAASAVSLGEITLRGGKQNIPAALFWWSCLMYRQSYRC
jgi:hypothetical protein